MSKDRNLPFLKDAEEEDLVLFNMLPHIKLLSGVDTDALEKSDAIKTYTVSVPDEEFSFMHEAAVIEYHGTLFAAWYNNEKTEFGGRTLIRYSCSTDDGKTWGSPQIVADDISGKMMYCPPVFGIDDDKLYLFINEMVAGDRMHALNLYLYDEDKKSFEMLWSKPIPFKINTNVYKLPNGKLILPGRIAEMDGFPNTPAVLISDSGKIDAEWRLIKIQENGTLPDGSELLHPEISAIIHDGKTYIFSRNDRRKVPLIYISEDNCESWSTSYSCDIPLSRSKIYSGTLSDGRNYLIGNLRPGRGRLAMFVSEKDTMEFTKGIMLQNGYSDELGYGLHWHYPVAYESNGKLYIVYTVNYDEDRIKRGLVISVVDLSKI